MDTGLLLLRVAIGLLLVGHGGQKLFGWFGGYGLTGTGGYLAALGYRPGLLFALLAGLGEGIGGALLVLGLATPVAVVLVVATMVNVYTGHAGKGLWNHNGGWELPFVLGTIGAAFGFTGPGSYSLDTAADWHLVGNAWGAGALGLGLVAGLVVQSIRHLTRHRLAVISSAA